MNPLQQISSRGLVKQNSSRAIAFQVLDSWFALPIEAIVKIIPCPPINSPIKDCLGLIEWEGQTITVIDLAQKLQLEVFPAKIRDNTSHRSLILIQTNLGELCGFVSENYPNLIDIPAQNIHMIPASYRQVAELGVIRQMAILPQPESDKNIKILLLGNWSNKFSSSYVSDY